MDKLKKCPTVLLILDGWGYSKNRIGNAIASGKTPNFDKLWQESPHALLSVSGLDVGLPDGQMGNSEVGHLHIGAGRLILQDLTKIDLAVENGSFFDNPVLNEAIEGVKNSGNSLHIFGLLSNGGVHSRNTHIEAMVELAAERGLKKVYLHAFLDGRDVPPKSALKPLCSMEEKMREVRCGKIVSICGRYYSMDRDKRWDRIQKAYDLFTLGKSDFHADNAKTAVEDGYFRGETDEFIQPTAIHKKDESPITIKNGDAVVFMNFRSDRGREMSYAFTDPNFKGFRREVVPDLASYVTLTSYASDLDVQVAYPKENLTNLLGEIVEKKGLKQLRISETEKYAHVTYFLNGGREEPFEGEDRILVPSPKVATYDMKPEMGILEVTSKLLEALRSEKHDMVICNFANPDMVGHTGNFEATIKAVEIVDNCIGKVVECLKKIGGEIVIIADHGNAEKMIDPKTGQPYTAHTTNLAPFIYSGRPANLTKEKGSLIDVAPTLLYLLGIEKPKEMAGDILLKLN